MPIIMKSVLKNLDETKGSNNHSSAEVNLQISSTRNPNSKEVLCIVEKLQWHLMVKIDLHKNYNVKIMSR